MRIEINASNVCNLKCRICTPTASSKWIKEGKDLYGWNEKIHVNLKAKNLEQVKSWADNLTELCFFGGEPLLSEENLNLLDFLIEDGYAKRISVLFNTNGTVFNDEISARLTHFKKVRFHFSIDDIGKRFEYQRSGAKWSDVEENLKAVYKLAKTPEWRNIEFKICCTVSTFNIYYFPEFFEYLNENFPGLKVLWNLLYDPWEYSVQVLPEKVKNVIEERLSRIKPTYSMTEGDTKTLETLVKFLNHKVDKPFPEFFRLVNRHDVYRKESFEQTFPEFYEIIKEYKPEDLTLGTYDSFDNIQQQMLKNIEDYKHLGFLENLRSSTDFDSKDSDIDLTEIRSYVKEALREISNQMTRDPHFEEKLELLEQLFNNEHFNLRDFIKDCFVFGPFEFYKSLSELDSKSLPDLLIRKYPVEMAYKYVN